MADVATSEPVPAAAAEGSPAKKGKKTTKPAGAKKPKAKPNHPKTSEMVTSALKNLKERNGSSLQAIKKYIAANYSVDAEKLAPFIRKSLKSAVISGKLVQTKGKGASGSFKLSAAAKTTEKPKKPKAVVKKTKTAAVKKPKTAAAAKKTKAAGEKKAVKKPAAKKAAASPKKAAGDKKKVATAAKAAKKTGSAKVKVPKQKTTKASKKPTAASKPKAPKPKKAGSPKKAAPKKK
jgi:histone H1/5